jgi:hypothetical protein
MRLALSSFYQGLGDDDDDGEESDDSDFEGGARSTGSADASMDDGGSMEPLRPQTCFSTLKSTTSNLTSIF